MTKENKNIEEKKLSNKQEKESFYRRFYYSVGFAFVLFVVVQIVAIFIHVISM